MNRHIRQILVLVFAGLDIVSSFWLGDSLDQVPNPSVEPVYFLPFGLTFAIWGLIFSTGLLYAIYQLLPAQRERNLHDSIGWWIALNAALTALWNFTAGQSGQQGTPGFQPVYVVLTVFILAGMLFSLTKVFIILHDRDAELSRGDRWFVQLPVTLFFAWLNVAAIANSAAALSAVGFTGEPDGALWAVAMLIVATILASFIIRYSQPTIGTIVYTAVIVWALIGIFFNNANRSALVAGVCVAAALVVMLVTVFHLSRRSPSSGWGVTGQQTS
jgi:hypothetical protein